MDDEITTEQATELSGYNEVYLRTLLRAGKVGGRKFGRTWAVSRQSLLDYMASAETVQDRRFGGRGRQDDPQPL